MGLERAGRGKAGLQQRAGAIAYQLGTLARETCGVHRGKLVLKPTVVRGQSVFLDPVA